MKSPDFKSEEELASFVVPWLEQQNYEVFQEVQLYYGGRRADLVGRRGSTIVVVEVKLSFGERVIAQSQWWSHEATFSLVAIPAGRRHGLLEILCQHLGIGVLEVSRYEGVKQIVNPRMNRHRSNHLDDLNDAQKFSGAAGNAKSEYWTPFRQTCSAIREYLKAHDGATLKDTMAAVRHHYQSAATARGSIRKWVDLGKVPGVRSELEDRQIHLYLSETGHDRS